MPGSGNETKGRLEVTMGEENQLNDAKGAEGGPNHIINPTNASLLAAVKALTWQSHKVEIHLELTHMMAQSVLALDNKRNLLSSKLDKLGNTLQVDKMHKGTYNDEIMDKLSTLPELLASLIEHCKPGEETNKRGPSASIESVLGRETSTLTEGEEGSKEMKSDNREPSTIYSKRLIGSDTKVGGNSIEERASGEITKTLRESDIRNNQHLTRRQKKKLKTSLKVAKKQADRTA
ncbi:hypothetical protein NDU88_010331 [Pleurodeles waltl]|uniref:Uncharacterized protein n=1 Tax=Pleurodeles waltl TaxID=8319 RepID=A0AAV7PV87_PLEWA|nr:hypothetical protein NDU88_010331 [Pleurodeles waltl]